MKKSMFGVVILVFALLTGAVLYYRMRTVEQRTSDWQRVKDVPTKIWDGLKSIGRCFTNLFAAKRDEDSTVRIA